MKTNHFHLFLVKKRDFIKKFFEYSFLLGRLLFASINKAFIRNKCLFITLPLPLRWSCKVVWRLGLRLVFCPFNAGESINRSTALRRRRDLLPRPCLDQGTEGWLNKMKPSSLVRCTAVSTVLKLHLEHYGNQLNQVLGNKAAAKNHKNSCKEFPYEVFKRTFLNSTCLMQSFRAIPKAFRLVDECCSHKVIGTSLKQSIRDS